MYDPQKEEPAGSGVTNRELADEIDQLIKLRVRQALNAYDQSRNDPLFGAQLENEHAERIIRKIADSFQERDLRKGVYCDPQETKPRG